MENRQTIKELYTKRTDLYQLLFLKVFQCAQAMKKFFEQENLLEDKSKVLDAGCGTGLVTRVLSKMALRKRRKNVFFHAFDLTPAMLEVLEKWVLKKRKKNIQIREADVLKLDLPKSWNSYDLIVASAMLEHVPRKQIKKAIENLRNLLSPTGTLIIFITRRNGIMKWLIGKWWKANIYTPSQMRKILQESNLTNITFKKFPFPYSYLNYWGMIIEAKP